MNYDIFIRSALAYSVFLLNSLQIKLDIIFYLALHYMEKARATI
jgi:hypothetical protein